MKRENDDRCQRVMDLKYSLVCLGGLFPEGPGKAALRTPRLSNVYFPHQLFAASSTASEVTWRLQGEKAVRCSV